MRAKWSVLARGSPRRSPRRSPALLIAAMLMAFLAVIAFRTKPGDPESRLPKRYRLADLIDSQQASAAILRAEASRIRSEVDAERKASSDRSGGSEAQTQLLDDAEALAGLRAMSGPGLRVTLNDSKLDQPPEDRSVNDLVVHSQDVQAVVNALWRSGAEAIAINGQRLVSTSAVLCVGNTLLLNGTVHSPPYVVSAIGATRDRFDADRLVRRLKQDASAFSLTFSVERQSALQVPAYRGSTSLTYASVA